MYWDNVRRHLGPRRSSTSAQQRITAVFLLAAQFTPRVVCDLYGNVYGVVVDVFVQCFPVRQLNALYTGVRRLSVHAIELQKVHLGKWLIFALNDLFAHIVER